MNDDNYKKRHIDSDTIGLLMKLVPFLLLAIIGYLLVSGYSIPFIIDPVKIPFIEDPIKVPSWVWEWIF